MESKYYCCIVARCCWVKPQVQIMTCLWSYKMWVILFTLYWVIIELKQKTSMRFSNHTWKMVGIPKVFIISALASCPSF